jgi:hypothetical protein
VFAACAFSPDSRWAGDAIGYPEGELKRLKGKSGS